MLLVAAAAMSAATLGSAGAMGASGGLGLLTASMFLFEVCVSALCVCVVCVCVVCVCVICVLCVLNPIYHTHTHTRPAWGCTSLPSAH
jgi:nitrate/nitrite transporter NarK